MKKLLLMVMLIVAGFVSAQDVIITNDSRKIDAKIIEVSQTEVKYKEKNNPNGPTFVLNTKDINSIIYANGSVSTFNQTQTYSQQQAGSYQSNSQLNQGSFITKSGNTYFYNGKSMSESEYLNFVQNNCFEAFQSYQQGQQLWKTGWTLFGVGMGSVVLGAAFCWAPYSVIYSSILIGAGGGMVIGSVPCIAIGSVRKKNSYEIFNEQCARRATALEFGIQASQNGIGLAMKF